MLLGMLEPDGYTALTPSDLFDLSGWCAQPLAKTKRVITKIHLLVKRIRMTLIYLELVLETFDTLAHFVVSMFVARKLILRDEIRESQVGALSE